MRPIIHFVVGDFLLREELKKLFSKHNNIIIDNSNLSDVQNAICIGIAVTFSILLCKLLHYNAQSHFNPVVSTVSYINCEIKMKTWVVFILLQVLAALLAFGLFTKLQENKRL